MLQFPYFLINAPYGCDILGRLSYDPYLVAASN